MGGAFLGGFGGALLSTSVAVLDYQNERVNEEYQKYLKTGKMFVANAGKK